MKPWSAGVAREPACLHHIVQNRRRVLITNVSGRIGSPKSINVDSIVRKKGLPKIPLGHDCNAVCEALINQEESITAADGMGRNFKEE